MEDRVIVTTTRSKIGPHQDPIREAERIWEEETPEDSDYLKC